MRSSPCSRRRRCSGLGNAGGFKLQLRGPRRAGLAGAGRARSAGRSWARRRTGARTRSDPGLLQLPDQRAAAVRRTSIACGPSSWACRDRHLRHAADLPGLAVRERLQPLRPDVPGDRCRPMRRSAPHADDIAQLKTRNSRGEMVPLSSLLNVKQTFGPDSVDALQRLSLRRHQRRPGAGLFSPARRRRRSSASCRRDPAARHRASNGPSSTYQEMIAGNTMFVRVPAVRAAGVPGAGRAVRKPDAAAGGAS